MFCSVALNVLLVSWIFLEQESPQEPGLRDDVTIWRLEDGICLSYNSQLFQIEGKRKRKVQCNWYLIRQCSAFCLSNIKKISSWNAAENIRLSWCSNVIYWVENFYFPAGERIAWKNFLSAKLHIAAKYAKITNAFWNMSGYMQMITHEILKNYCSFFLSLASQRFIRHIFACVEHDMQRNDKNELLPHTERTYDSRSTSIMWHEGCVSKQTF